MKKNKIITILLSLVFIACQFFTVSAEDTVNFSMDSASGLYGDIVTLTVTATGGKDVTGFFLQISHDDSISYVLDSVKAIKSGLNDISAYESSGSGILNVLWESGTKQNLDSALFSVQFRIQSNEEKVVPLSLTVKDLYSNHTDYAKIPSTVQGGTVTITAPSQAVIDVIEAIEQLPDTITEKNCDEADLLIRNVIAEYTALNLNEQKRVSNYSKLLDAMDQLRAVRGEKSKKQAEELAKKFRSDHAAVLSLEVKDVTLKDEAKIAAALKAYSSMNNPEAQALLIKEKNYLNNLKTQIEVLKQAEADRIAQEEAIRQELEKAKEIIAEFHSDMTYEWLFTQNVSLDEININNYKTYFEAAQLAKATYSFYSPIVQGEMQEEINFIESIFDRIEEVLAEDELNNTPEMLAYYSYLRNFSYLFNMSEEDVTADDYIDLMVAVNVYDTLYIKTQNMLADEYDKLCTLLDIAEALYEEEAAGDEGESDDNGSSSEDSSSSDTNSSSQESSSSDTNSSSQESSSGDGNSSSESTSSEQTSSGAGDTSSEDNTASDEQSSDNNSDIGGTPGGFTDDGNNSSDGSDVPPSSDSQGDGSTQVQTPIQNFISNISPYIFWLLIITAVCVLLMFAAMGVWIYMNKKYPILHGKEETADVI